MSRNNPIPTKLRGKFFAYMNANDIDELSDGAWFFHLEQSAEQFMERFKLHGCANSAAHQYIRLCQDKSK